MHKLLHTNQGHPASIIIKIWRLATKIQGKYLEAFFRNLVSKNGASLILDFMVGVLFSSLNLSFWRSNEWESTVRSPLYVNNNNHCATHNNNYWASPKFFFKTHKGTILWILCRYFNLNCSATCTHSCTRRIYRGAAEHHEGWWLRK